MRGLIYLTSVSLLFFTSITHAHGRWLIPSATIVSGDEPTPLSVDISLSNDVFHPDRSYGGIPLDIIKMNEEVEYTTKPSSGSEAALRDWNASVKLKITSPTGETNLDSTLIDLGNKSSSATWLVEDGTYTIETSHPPVRYIQYTTADGEPGKKFGPFDLNALPKGAKDVKKVQLEPILRTYVTRNTLSEKTLAMTGKGLELMFSAHPNELFAGESSTVSVLFDGEKLTENTAIKLTRAGTRYRNNRNQMQFTPDKDGRFKIDWKQADMYVLEVEAIQMVKDVEVHSSIYLTLEVNPE